MAFGPRGGFDEDEKCRCDRLWLGGNGAHRRHQCHPTGAGDRGLLVASPRCRRALRQAWPADEGLPEARGSPRRPVDRCRRHHELSQRAPGSGRGCRRRRQAHHPREADGKLAGRGPRHRRRGDEAWREGMRLLRVPVLEPVPSHEGPPRRRAPRPSPLRRSRLLPRHRSVVRPVPLEHRQEGWRQCPPHRRLSCPRRADAVDGGRGGERHEPVDEVIKRSLRSV